jgi:hypothetical protein
VCPAQTACVEQSLGLWPSVGFRRSFAVRSRLAGAGDIVGRFGDIVGDTVGDTVALYR